MANVIYHILKTAVPCSPPKRFEGEYQVMNEDSKSRPGPPEPILAMISGWLTLRGLAWLATSTGLLDLNFLQSTPLLDGAHWNDVPGSRSAGLGRDSRINAPCFCPSAHARHSSGLQLGLPASGTLVQPCGAAERPNYPRNRHR